MHVWLSFAVVWNGKFDSSSCHHTSNTISTVKATLSDRAALGKQNGPQESRWHCRRNCNQTSMRFMEEGARCVSVKAARPHHMIGPLMGEREERISGGEGLGQRGMGSPTATTGT